MFFPLHRLNFSTPFSFLKTIEEFADTAFNNASQLSEFEAIKRVSSIVGRAITAILGHGLTRSANTRGLLSANPAFLQTCSDILWFLRWDFWFENLCSSQLNSACNVYEAGRTSSSASNSYSATAFLPHSNFGQRPVCSSQRGRSFLTLGTIFWLSVSELQQFS